MQKLLINHYDAIDYNERNVIEWDPVLNLQIEQLKVSARVVTDYVSAEDRDDVLLMWALGDTQESDIVSGVSNITENWDGIEDNTFDYGVAHFTDDYTEILFFPLVEGDTGQMVVREIDVIIPVSKKRVLQLEQYHQQVFYAGGGALTAGQSQVLTEMRVGVYQ